MNPEWFGDSYDIIKRYFVGLLKSNGYRVFVDPMFTGNWQVIQEAFYRFVGAPKFDGNKNSGERTALLLDPDTGIGKHKTAKHITIDTIIEELKQHDLVFSFDQSFSRNRTANEQMIEKLNFLSDKGLFAFYYDSHARFLFVGKSQTDMEIVLHAIQKTGLPKSRLILGNHT
ncbi:hypothetical protein BVY01_04940 [bacterium I07]|nr:hypothetical protein BVY01_04940 [bacterium I07]